MEQTRISGQHGNHEARSARASGKSSAPQHDSAAQGADTNGFSFLLASLGDGGVAAEAPDATFGALADAQDPAALAALQSGLPHVLQQGLQAQAGAAAGADGLAGGAARWMGGQGSDAGARDLAALAGAPGLAGQGGLSGMSGMAFGAEKAGLQSLVGQTAMLDGAAEAAGVNGTAPVGGTAPWRGAVSGRFQSTLAAAGVDASSGAGGAGALNSALRGLAHDDRKGVAPDLGAASAVATAAAGPSLDRRDALQGGGAAGARSNIDASPAMASAQISAAADAPAGGDARSSGRGGESAGQGTSSLTYAAAGESGSPLSGAEAGFSLDSAAVDPAQAAMEDQLAEQVAFWVNQKTQSAELTLDRDGQPVEVTVSLTGTEAHVTFRSDQADTREMLDTTVAQLRELLQSEGLQLAGVTVGSSGGQGARDGDTSRGDARPGARQATVQAAGAGAPAARAQQVTDRSVDIFV